MTSRRRGVGLTPMETRRDVIVRTAVLADELGYEIFAVPEGWGLDSTPVLTEIALRTTRIHLASGVLSVWGRTPATLAMTAATLHQVCGGRYLLGLGTSTKALAEGFHDTAFEHPAAKLRDAVTKVRALLAGQPAQPSHVPAARPLRRSPIYERLKAHGAVMGANFGLEHALWFAPTGMPPTETPTYRRSEAFPCVRAECQAVRSDVGIYETTNYGKYEVTGRGAREWLDRVFACRVPQPGRLRLAPMLNPAGRIMGDLSMACLAEDRFMIVGSGFAEEFHMRWFSLAEPPPNVWVRSIASTLTGVSIAGPRARELLQPLVRTDLSAQAFKLFRLTEIAVGFSPAILTRAGFTGELGYEIWTTPDYFATLYDELWNAGRELGLTHFGGRALSSLRLEKGYGSFNKDFRPDYTPGETGLERFIDFEKPDFVGRAAALAERARGPTRRFVVMEVAHADCEVVGYESIMKDGAAVGYVTSGVYGHCIGKSLAAGYVPAALAREGARLEIDILGEMRTATVRLEPLYDPQGARLRS